MICHLQAGWFNRRALDKLGTSSAAALSRCRRMIIVSWIDTIEGTIESAYKRGLLVEGYARFPRWFILRRTSAAVRTLAETAVVLQDHRVSLSSRQPLAACSPQDWPTFIPHPFYAADRADRSAKCIIANEFAFRRCRACDSSHSLKIA